MPPLPAHATKHEALLDYEFFPTELRGIIQQDDSLIDSTGRTIWLGAQVLSVYLYDLLKKERNWRLDKSTGLRRPQRVIDLGGGTGLLSLYLHKLLGYDVVSTDIALIADGILAQNLRRNSPLGGESSLQARTLDWFSPPSEWDFQRESISPPSCSSSSPPSTSPRNLLQPPFDMIVTTDSIYSPSLCAPLLRTLHALSTPPFASALSPPVIFLSLEVRDPELIDGFMRDAREEWGFKCGRVDEGRLERLLEGGKGGMGWESEDWRGVEVWKLRFSKGWKKREMEGEGS